MATTADAVHAHRALEDEDESVRIAVRALGDMRSGRRASSKRSLLSAKHHLMLHQRPPRPHTPLRCLSRRRRARRR
jgi:hypothetical protein